MVADAAFSESVFTFKNVREVIKAEALLRRHGFSCKVVPLPKALSSECGMCLQLPVEKYASALAILQQEGPLPFQK